MGAFYFESHMQNSSYAFQASQAGIVSATIIFFTNPMLDGVAPNEIEIFKAGEHTSSNGITLSFSTEDLDAVVANYDPNTFDAPAVVGHPRDNSPAYGWVESIRRVGNTLLAKLKDIDTNFHEAVKNKRYKKISASFYSPDSPSNPKPGNYYLRHVGFLGGMAPAVKGLKSVAFAEVEQGVIDFCGWGEDNEVLRRLREFLIEEYDIETADKTIPSYLASMPDSHNETIRYLEQRITTLESQLAEFWRPDLQERLEQVGSQVMQALRYNEYNEEMDEENLDFEEREAALLLREQRLAERETALKRARIMDFVESRVDEGKLTPADKTEMVEFMCSLDEKVVEFSEETKVAPLDWFQNWLKRQAKVVEYREVAREAKPLAQTDAKVVANQAKKIVAERKAQGITISFAEAVNEAMGGGN